MVNRMVLFVVCRGKVALLSACFVSSPNADSLLSKSSSCLSRLNDCWMQILDSGSRSCYSSSMSSFSCYCCCCSFNALLVVAILFIRWLFHAFARCSQRLIFMFELKWKCCFTLAHKRDLELLGNGIALKLIVERCSKEDTQLPVSDITR